MRILLLIFDEFVHLVQTGWREYWWRRRTSTMRECCSNFPESIDKATLRCRSCDHAHAGDGQ